MPFDGKTWTDERVAGSLALASRVIPPAGMPLYDDVADAIGSIRLITDQSGNLVQRHDCQPFGTEFGSPTNLAGNKLFFAGKERDTETAAAGDWQALDYFGARHYQNQIGRFTTVDPVSMTEAQLVEPQRLNRYAYAISNPFRYVDPFGLDPCEAGTYTTGDCERVTAKAPPPPSMARPRQDFLYGQLAGISDMVLTPQVSNFAAGVGDALTGRMIPGVNTSLTEYARNRMGTGGVVAKSSSSYGVGELTGGTVGWALAGSASATAAAIANGKYGALFGRGGEALFNQGPVRFGWYWNGTRDAIGLRIGQARGTNWWSHIPFWYR